MEIVNRVKNILTAPKTEWTAIEEENTPHAKLFTTYVLPLAVIPAIAAFIGYGLIGHSILGIRVGSVGLGIQQAISQFIVSAGGVYLTAFVINFLAENFGAKKNFDKAFSLVAYAYTPMFLGGVFLILPSLSLLSSLAGLYGLYLLYVGLQPIMKSPEDKTTTYFVVSLLAMIVVAVVLGVVLGIIMGAGLFL